MKKNYKNYFTLSLLMVIISSTYTYATIESSYKELRSTLDSITISASNKTEWTDRQSIFKNFGQDLSSSNNLTKQKYLDSLNTLVQNYTYLKRGKNYDPSQYPYFALVSAQLQAIIIGNSEMTADNKKYLVNLLGLPVRYQSLFLKYSLWITDNEKMTDKDLLMIERFMELLPPWLRYVKNISNWSYFVPNNDPNPPFYRVVPGFNTFSTIGGYKENPFPSDYPSYVGDGFTTVVYHEGAHNFEPGYISTDPILNKWKKDWQQKAGQVDLEYLRSQVGGAYFSQNPQEAVASICNQYLLNSKYTLNHSRNRFNKGYKGPINQFLFMVSVMAGSTDTSLFWWNDNTGMGMKTEKVLVTKRDDKRITSLLYKDSLYRFSWNQNLEVDSILAIPVQTNTNQMSLKENSTIAMSINYASDKKILHIKTQKPGMYTIELYTAKGALFEQKRVKLSEGSTLYHIPAMKQGCYFVKMSSSVHGTSTKKLLTVY